MDNQAIGLIKNFLSLRKIKITSLTLFGSRARGDNSCDSDYDIIIVAENALNNPAKRQLKVEIKRMLIENKMMFPFDLLIKSKSEFDDESRFIGNICYDALREGIAL